MQQLDLQKEFCNSIGNGKHISSLSKCECIKLQQGRDYIKIRHMISMSESVCAEPTLSHGNSYVFYEVAICTTTFAFAPVMLGLVFHFCIFYNNHTFLHDSLRMNFSQLVKYVGIVVRSGWQNSSHSRGPSSRDRRES